MDLETDIGAPSESLFSFPRSCQCLQVLGQLRVHNTIILELHLNMGLFSRFFVYSPVGVRLKCLEWTYRWHSCRQVPLPLLSKGVTLYIIKISSVLSKNWLSETLEF